ncbi:hypothetical protein KC356_g193 [Hortaea werneckii]|nr:hypothetical protein KC356_g193 [Hortaea werneckii]
MVESLPSRRSCTFALLPRQRTGRQFSRRVFGKAFSARRARSAVTTSPFSHSVRSSGSRLPMFGWRARTVASSVGVIRVSVTFLRDSSSTSPTGSAQHLPDEKDITSDSIAWSNILKAKSHIVRQDCGPVRISNAFRLAGRAGRQPCRH